MKWELFVLLLLLFNIIGCESDLEHAKHEWKEMEAKKEAWEPSDWVRDWVEKEYNPPKVDKPKVYYLNNIRNPRIGMHIDEFVPDSISFENIPILRSSRYISSNGVMETWQYGPNLYHPWKKFTFLNDRLISVFEY